MTNSKKLSETTTPTLEQTAEQIDVQVINTVGELNDNAAPDETLEDSDKEQNNSPNIINEEMAGTILKTPFAVTAAFLGDYWELTDGELELMKPSASTVFSDLFGKYIDDYPEAYMLGFSLLTCVGSRAAIMARERRRNPAPEAIPMPVVYEDSDEV